ncbi:MAG: hypothetical protein ACOCX4_08260 [Planctomycetota bacterium]
MRGKRWLPALLVLALAVAGCMEPQEEPLSAKGMEGKKALQAGEVQKAFDLLADASQENSENASDQMAYGDAAMAAERYDVAFMAYERALILKKNNAEAMMGMARAVEKLGAPVLALQYYQAALLHGRGETYADAEAKVKELGEVVAKRQ